MPPMPPKHCDEAKLKSRGQATSWEWTVCTVPSGAKDAHMKPAMLHASIHTSAAEAVDSPGPRFGHAQDLTATSHGAF